MHGHLRRWHANLQSTLQREEERGRRGPLLRGHRKAGIDFARMQSESMPSQVKRKPSLDGIGKIGLKLLGRDNMGVHRI